MVIVSGCAKPAPVPSAERSLQPVGDGGWQTYRAVLGSGEPEPAASYEGVYPAKPKQAPTKFRIEVQVPGYGGVDPIGASLIERTPGKPPAEVPYVLVRVYAGDRHLPVTPAHIVPRGPCGPTGTPPSAVSVAVHTGTDAMRKPPQPPGSPYRVAYSQIYVRFDADPGQLATCALDFTAAIGDGKLRIPPLHLVNDAVPQYSPSVNVARASE